MEGGCRVSAPKEDNIEMVGVGFELQSWYVDLIPEVEAIDFGLWELQFSGSYFGCLAREGGVAGVDGVSEGVFPLQ